MQKLVRIRLSAFITLLLLFSICSTIAMGYRSDTVKAATTYIHPGMLHTQSDLDRMKSKVAASSSPWINQWHMLQDNSLASSSFTPSYYSTIYVDDPTNGTVGMEDLKNSASAAYFNALEWYITGNQAYANEAKALLNGWSNTLTSIQGPYPTIPLGLAGYKLLNAAEILRYTNAGWLQADIDKFSTMMTNVFYSWTTNYAGLNNVGAMNNGGVDALVILFNICYGVWNNDDTSYNSAVNYYKTGAGNGSISHFIQTVDGQTQEVGRDEAHNQLAVGMLTNAAEIGLNQATVNANGADMASYPNNSYLLLKGLEYTAKYNLGYSVPYKRVQSPDGKAPYTQISTESRGIFRPIYEQAYSLFHNKIGLPDSNMPFTKQAINSMKLEGYNSDHPSYGGLLNAQDTRTAPLIPSIVFSARSLPNSVISAASGGSSPLIDNVSRFNSDGTFHFGPSETFTMEYQGSKQYAFKSAINNLYVSANNGGSAYLIANSSTIASPQLFNLSEDNNSLFSFQSKANNLYETVDGTNQIAATASGITSDSQRFDILTQRAAVISSTPPTTPTNLTASPVNNNRINLNWTASTDDVGIVGYKIFRNSVQVGTAYTNSYTDTGLYASTAYSYTVQAYDPANNVSAQSNTATNVTPGTNLALNKSVTSSSSFECCGWSRTVINDGQENSVSGAWAWASSNSLTTNHTEWVQIDMGANNTISQVALFLENDGIHDGYCFPIDFNIQVSTDGANWTTVVTKTNYPFINTAQSFTFTPTSARYVKVTGTNLRSNPYDSNYYRMNFAELEIYQQVISGATYKLAARHSGKLAGINGASLSDGAIVLQQTDSGSNAQKWVITDLGTGYYKIVNVNSGRAMDVNGASTADGATFIQWPFSGSNNQQWQIIDVGSGFYKIIARHSGKGMDVSGGSTADGTQIQQWTYGGYNNEQWQLVKQ